MAEQKKLRLEDQGTTLSIFDNEEYEQNTLCIQLVDFNNDNLFILNQEKLKLLIQTLQTYIK